jgi:hypothetical protein
MSDKQFCEDCEHCQEQEELEVGFSKCKAAPQDEWVRLSRITKDESKIKCAKYYYCTTERTKDTCDNFKQKGR